MTVATERLCYSCHSVRQITYVDGNDRGHCGQRKVEQPVTSITRAMGLLSSTTPFKVEDRVEARTAGERFDGIGAGAGIDLDNMRQGGTAVESVYREIDGPPDDNASAEGLCTAPCLTKSPEREPVA
jgi:hypothetical protein